MTITIARVADLQIEGDWDESLILEAESALKSEEGVLPPIVLDPKNRIIQGATTVLAARRLGISMLAATIVQEEDAGTRGRGDAGAEAPSPNGLRLPLNPLSTSPTLRVPASFESLPEETDRTDVPTATLLDTDGQKRTFHIKAIGGSSVVIGGKLYPIVDVELNEIAIALLDDTQLDYALNSEASLAFSAADAAVSAAASALLRARKSGLYLLEKRSRTKKGGWLPWLKAKCPEISERRAQDWMQIAKHWDEIEKNAMHRGLELSSLSMGSALKLLRGKESDEGKGDKGASVAPNQLRLAIDEHTPPPATTRLPTLDEICTAFSLSLPSMPAGRVHWAAQKTFQNLTPKISELSDGELLELNREAIALARIAEQLLEERNNVQAS
jgi:hypothetical protein